jgi:hypothetical protein
MLDLFKSKAGWAVLESFLKAKSQGEAARREAANDRLSIYHDSWKDLLKKILATQFQPENFKKILLMENTSQNILKKVVKDVSVIYKESPRRSFGTKPNDLLEGIYKELEIDEFMKKVNRYGNLLYDLLIRVGWDFEKEKITLNLNTPANTSVIQRDGHPEEAAAVYYDIDYIDTKFKAEKYYIYWSADEHFLFDDKLRVYAPSEDNKDMLNPFNVLPFAILHIEQIPDCFWNPTAGADLVEGTLNVGFKRTLKDYSFKFQSFKQPWVRSQNAEDIPKQLLLDPAFAIALTGEGSEIGALDLQANFTEMDQTLQGDINAFLGTYGLSVDMFTVSPNELSGKALTMKNRGLREIREAQLPAYRRLENDIFKLIRTVWNTYNPGKKIPEELEFKVDFAELEMYVDPKDKRDQARADLKDGLLSPGEYYMIFNPDIKDEKEAEKKITENLSKTEKIKGGRGVFGIQDIFGMGNGAEDQGGGF